jgi:tRNA 2-thiouridine synthesizing protein E
MVRVHVRMLGKNEPLKRVDVALRFDVTGETVHAYTDRNGIASFECKPSSGKVLVADIPRYHGHLEGDIHIQLWSLLESGSVSERGAPGGSKGGSTAYPGMQTQSLKVDGHEVLIDSEGYLVNLDDWSEEFVRAEAEREALQLMDDHWEVIRFLRDYYEAHHVQASVRDVIKHFKQTWGAGKGNNHYLHSIFPRGGPQKQGNRLAGLLRTKGEH